MEKTLIIIAAALLSWNAAWATAPEVAGIVSVSTSADGARKRVGFVADGLGHILARINAPDAALFVSDAGGGSYSARTIAYDKVSNLALLKVDGDAANLNPYTFARDPGESERRVFGIQVAEELAQSQAVAGTLSSVQQSDSNSRSGYYLHNALVGEAAMGGPLFNNCGEVIGVNIPRPGFLARLLVDDEKSTAYAVPAAWLVDQFSPHGLQPTPSENACLSEDEQAAAAQAELDGAIEAAETAQAELDAAAQAVTAAQAELDAAQAELEAAQEVSEAERQRLEAELEARESALRAARDQELEAQNAHQGALTDLREAEERVKEYQEREKQYKLWGMLGAVALLLLLLLLLLVWTLKQRTVTRERNEKVAAKIHAEQAQASLTAREEEEARIRLTPTVFFDGKDSTGRALALRIPGASIAADNGAIVGRNPASSDFVINHPEVSRRQFRLFTNQHLLMIEDLGSTNGTIVNGEFLGAGQKAVLADLSSVELSGLKLSVRFEQG